MKFIHTADWHIGANRRLSSYLQRQEEMIDCVFDVAYDHDIRVVAIAGDIFEDPDTTTQEEREMLQRKLLQYDSAGFTILMIPGNHDTVDATGYSGIHYLSMLTDSGKFKHSTVTERTSFVTVEDCVFCLLRHRKNKFAEDSAAAVNSIFGSSLIHDHKDFVMICHETIRGSQTDIRLKDGSSFCLDSGEDAPDTSLPVTYWALGDIHKPQEVAPNAYYSGAPLQTKFADGWPRGVLVVDTQNPTEPKFVAIPSNQFVKVKVGDPVPDNAHVKWVFSSREDIPKEVPDSVVMISFEPETSLSSDRESLQIDVHASFRDKILAGIKGQGATEEELSLAAAEVDSILPLIEVEDGF